MFRRNHVLGARSAGEAVAVTIGFFVIAVACMPHLATYWMAKVASAPSETEVFGTCSSLIYCSRYNRALIWLAEVGVEILGRLLSFTRVIALHDHEAVRTVIPPVKEAGHLVGLATGIAVRLLMLLPILFLALRRLPGVAAPLLLVAFCFFVLGGFGPLGSWVALTGFRLLVPKAFHSFFDYLEFIGSTDFFLIGLTASLVLWLSRADWRLDWRIVLPVTAAGQVMAENIGMYLGVSLAAMVMLGDQSLGARLRRAATTLWWCGLVSVAVAAMLGLILYLRHGTLDTYGGNPLTLHGFFAEAMRHNWPNWKLITVRIAYGLSIPTLAGLVAGALSLLLAAPGETDRRCLKAAFAVWIGFASNIVLAFAALVNLNSEMGREIIPAYLLSGLAAFFAVRALAAGLGARRGGVAP